MAIIDFLKWAWEVRCIIVKPQSRASPSHTHTLLQCQWCDFVKWPRLLHGHSQAPLPSGQPHKSSSVYLLESNLPLSILQALRVPDLGTAMWRNLRLISIELWPAVTPGRSSGVTKGREYWWEWQLWLSRVSHYLNGHKQDSLRGVVNQSWLFCQ